MVMKPTIEILDHCSGCGACAEICPVLCLRVRNGLLEIVNEEFASAAVNAKMCVPKRQYRLKVLCRDGTVCFLWEE